MNYPPNLHIHTPLITSIAERDWKAMTELFDREDGDEIEADIHTNLLLMTPEPCWGDDPFEFLREYL
ncbi:MAG: hypothetical protein KME32_06920 [Mojavia pulchra JT2-VF2]|uniref:Uncharacterized protein n=1 Tax=Mojavia pulchra JT2-VF2 TaxID=287848 RepID=A0A951UEU4_9NOST|nr:hypothetical protein [Mojavia pulchra JT2-VF2]